METRNMAVLVAAVLVFAAAMAVIMPFEPAEEGDASPDEGIAPASLPDETAEEDGSGAAVLGVGLVALVLGLLVVRFWTLKVE